MSRTLLVLRPEPGNARTVAAAQAMGLAAAAMPLFAAVPLAWTPPDRGAFDAVLLTSANAARYGGKGVAALHLPVLAVGEATAAAVRAAGLVVALTGDGDGARLVALGQARGFARLLHLAGRERTDLGIPAIAVYASEPLPDPPGAAERLRGAVVLLHSARAAGRVAELAGDRTATRLAALGEAVLAAAGEGWERAVVAPAPTDAALLGVAAALAD